MDKITLRKLVKSDKGMIFEWISNPELRRFTGTTGKPNKTTHNKWFLKKMNSKDPLFVIEADSLPVGLIGTNVLDIENKNAEIFVYIGDASNRKKGIGKNAVGLFLKILFDQYNIHKVYCRIFSFNHASIKMFKSLGFIQEGCLKEQVFIKEDSSFYDLYLFGIVRGVDDEKNNDFGG